MHADRWSATAWIVALLVDVVLIAYLAASVSGQTPWPPPGPRGAELVRPGETVCDAGYVARQLAASTALDEETWTLVDRHERAGTKDQRAIAMQFQETSERRARVEVARLRCDELETAIRVRRLYESDLRWREIEARAAAERARHRRIRISKDCMDNPLAKGCP